jgi:hypothetical protein
LPEKRILAGKFLVDEIEEKGEQKVEKVKVKEGGVVKAKKAGWICMVCGEWLAPPETPESEAKKIQSEHIKVKHPEIFR